MATLAREILTLDGMDLRISCLGMSYVGINVAGTWAGTVYFEGSLAPFGDSGAPGGSEFKTTGVYAQPSPPTPISAVYSSTVGGNWFWPVQNYSTFRVRFSRTSGSALVVLAASIDSSWSNAFLAASGRFVNSFANGTRNLLTIPADANFGKRLRSLVVSVAPHVGGGAGTGSSSAQGPSVASWASNPILQIKDGSTVLWATDLQTTLPFQYNVPLPPTQTTNYGIKDGGVYATPGNDLTIDLANAGTGVTTNLNAEISNA